MLKYICTTRSLNPQFVLEFNRLLVTKPAGCLIFVDDRLEVDTNATGFNETAVLVSPLYNRSRDGHSKCLKFRYMLRGPGEKTLTIYQKEGNHRETPVWVSKWKTGANWIYGQVPLSSISKLQVR